MVTKARLEELLTYDSETGVFTWLISHGRAKVGSTAGCDCRGYVVIRVDGILYRAHRLAWLYSYGTWPDGEIDHKNRDKSDNRLSNLRVASSRENKQNCGIKRSNKSGASGVWFDRERGKWQATIRANGKRLHLGRYLTASEAAEARLTAEKKYHHFKHRG